MVLHILPPFGRLNISNSTECHSVIGILPIFLIGDVCMVRHTAAIRGPICHCPSPFLQAGKPLYRQLGLRRTSMIRVGPAGEQSFRWIHARISGPLASHMLLIAFFDIQCDAGVDTATPALDQIQPPRPIGWQLWPPPRQSGGDQSSPNI